MKKQFAILFGSGPTAYSRSYCSLRGNSTRLAKNSRGQWCATDYDKAPATWVKRETAQAKIDKIVAMKLGHPYVNMTVIELGPTNKEIEQLLRDNAGRLVQALRSAIRQIHDLTDYGSEGSIDYADDYTQLLRELGEV